MDADLRQHFDQAVSDDPGADPAAMARAAIVQGGQVRRRRQIAVAGVAAGVIMVLGVGLGLRSGGPESADPPTTVAAAMMLVAAPSCTPNPVESDATDVAIFTKQDITGGQQSALRSALEADSRVTGLTFEDRATAYERFKALWKDSPDFVASVGPEALPESFRLRLTDPARYDEFRRQYAAMDGVQDVIGRICAPDAPVGGLK